ncbi:glycosyl hydrolase family 20 beta-N-acetylhexosaminidase family protein (macronuclear) [Tetrahymena thermophila SB210]|uniref:Beta-hexosaminidase n=1 Tax=Tetrahymena thermophila (strain SB210) TaxID=312017 RepID=I7M1F1_TETTS|nr:glycosyl hydrolase family 20 beta-N-acetylhexosaminidase family protein [Tetrahymena thermophila SB210]EAR96206.1 glycosyl hydrolase family 20 beta-N-acetylhexosaminidase family protein [Tetrahymena thermophila SB210]|eukprot:XP_001016451.1 glycosyl hydrolase family 20 beta-N-acetylhexosaminidase family protein [Tetrahymena thermophila SB210]
MQKILLITFLLGIALAQITPGVDPISAKVMPKPKNYTYGDLSLLVTDPCGISYRPSVGSGKVPNHVYQIIGFYTLNIFNSNENSCAMQRELYKNETTIEKMRRLQHSQNIVFDIFIQDAALATADTLEDEYYDLQIYNTTYWKLTANKYVGLLRGLETYSQLFTQDEDTEDWYLNNIPISIQDQPDYIYRGLMIDSARHFLSVETILKTIDSMLFNKLNVLHWHITDTESFPFPLKSFPNITKYGAYSKKKQYSFEDIQYIVDQALNKGIQVIPEVDSPGHAFSWARSPQFSSIGLLCDQYNGQLDPTLNLTYTAVKGIMEDMNTQFYTAKYVHFGGDEVEEQCWNKRPEIKEFMNQNNISTYTDLQNYYRKNQVNIWKSINATKPAIFWADSNTLKYGPDDIIQWWGSTHDFSSIKDLPNKIILSFYDNTYLDVGEGNRYGGSYGSMYNWDVLNSFNPRVPGIKGEILGGETCLWSEMNDDSTQFQRLWTRNSAFAERLWNTDAANNETYKTRALVSRMVFMQHRLTARGIPASPVTVGICEQNLSLCYN